MVEPEALRSVCMQIGLRLVLPGLARFEERETVAKLSFKADPATCSIVS